MNGKNTGRRVTAVVSVFFVFFSTWSQANDILVPMPRSQFDLSHSYHVQLLEKALAKTADEGEIPTIRSTVSMVESRAMMELEKGELLTLSWLGTDDEKEKRLYPIPIPTTKGLIGFRKFFVQRNSAYRFRRVSTIAQLTSFVACQGKDWPDTIILKQAGLPVATTSHYEDLFAMLNAGRCDYFPRGLHDFEQELVARQATYPNLVQLEELVLHYPFAVYFFTSKDKAALAQRIHRGLVALHQSGEFLTHMRTHALTKMAFPLAQPKGTQLIQIANSQFSNSPLRQQATEYMFTVDVLEIKKAGEATR
ncbi:hypothetical protein DRW07_09915 [Alteromonas sediminis]|uniref:Solute-binding protein family 3/N-terminal domain-containing protein n=1 Tax=Alteromonas sediminis TaxID=2259342 RepID=A0A3N5YM79_9ALTE|nr:hypothetical protein [Alteromonas sediminis]RPJ66401.1 hypothetical protein DRW07_09915 [Alteromonas sediminis]